MKIYLASANDKNSYKNKDGIKTDMNNYQTIIEDSTLVKVKYFAKGGEEISVRVKGIKRKLHT